MPQKEKGRLSDPIPNAVLGDIAESKASKPKAQVEFADALTRSVFGRSYVVVREPIASRCRSRAPSRIRAWRSA
jgi:hypothetical protein